MTLKKLDEKNYSVPTRLIYGKSVTTEWDYTHHVVPPISGSSTYRLDSARRGAEGFGAIGQLPVDDTQPPIYVYSRMGNPNSDLLQHALAVAEEGEICVTYSTGMAAVHAAACALLDSGAEIISHNTVYGCTFSMFSRWLSRIGIKVHFVDFKDPQSFLPLVSEKTRIVYLETPVNPNLELLDLEAICTEIARLNSNRTPEKQIFSIVDNTFSTPWSQRPLTKGADMVVHSLTKGISGFGVDMGGAVITRHREFYEPLTIFRKDFGSILAPEVAWRVLNYGISTLQLRMPRQQENAIAVAKFLEAHPKVERVNYPGLESFPQAELAKRQMLDYRGNFAPGFMLYFVLKGSPEEAKIGGEKVMDYLAENAYCVTLAVSLGQLRTLIEHPGSMTHVSYPADEQVKRGIDPGGIRLSVGIEEPADIIRDLEAALGTV